MIGHLVLFAEENISSSKSILRYILTSTAYLPIDRTESALLVLCKTCARAKRGHAPFILTQNRLLLINEKRLDIATPALLPLKDVSSVLKDSNGVLMKENDMLNFWHCSRHPHGDSAKNKTYNFLPHNNMP